MSAENKVGAEKLYIASRARAIRATVTMSNFRASASLSGFSRWQIFEKLEKIHPSTPNVTPAANFSTGHIDSNLESIVRIARARMRLNLSLVEAERRLTQYTRFASSRSYLVNQKGFSRLSLPRSEDLKACLRRVKETQQRLKLDLGDPHNLNGRFVAGTFQMLPLVYFHGLRRAHSEPIHQDVGLGEEVVSVGTIQYPVDLISQDTVLDHQHTFR